MLLLLGELKIESYCLVLTMARARVRPDGDGTEQRVIGTAVAGDHTSRDRKWGWARSLRAFYARRRNLCRDTFEVTNLKPETLT